MARRRVVTSIAVMHGDYFPPVCHTMVLTGNCRYISERGIPIQTEKFASLAQIILERALRRNPQDEERITHWLGEAHHSQSLAEVVIGVSDGIEHVNAWSVLLHGRIQKYAQISDMLALATAHNQMGMCLARKGLVEDAVKSFQKSLQTYRSVEDAPQFSGTFPAISLSGLLVLEGRLDEAEQALTPTLKEHEDVLGKDDVSTTE
jgi:tetratricopeptide (TPR) repeat protein